MSREAAQAAGWSLLETLFPGRCLLCGAWLLLESNHRVPLCAECEATISPQAGPSCTRCGVRLVAEAGWQPASWFEFTGLVGYGIRNIHHQGLSLGLAAAFLW